MAMYATNRFVGDGVTTSYEFNFVGGYLDRAHVKAYVEDVNLVRTPVTLSPGNFLGPYTIGGLAPVPVGSTLVIYRDTPKTPLVNFVNGSRFTEYNLDTATRQGSFIAAEGADAVSPTGLAGVVQQVSDFSASAAVARDQAVAAKQAAAASSDAASLSASNAKDSEISAATDAAIALNNKNLSDTAAYNAAVSKTGADSARDAAVIAKNAAEAALDSFDDRYLGAKAVAPTTDNDGGALLTGALYWDTVLPGMRSWNGGAWVTLPAATKASVGLANVNDTSDADKPVSTAQSAAIAASTASNIHEAAAKITPADADELGLSDSAASWGLKKLTFANLKTWLARLFVSKSGDTMTGPLTVEGENYADIMIRAYGNSGDGAVFHGNQALGTKAAPLPPSARTPIFGIGARPWTGTQWAAHSTAAIHMFAREDVSNTAQGTSFRIAVTPLGGTWSDRIHAVAFECDGVGQGARWRGKFSGATQAQRSFVQDASGASTAFGVLSGGASGSGAAVNCFSRSDPDNSPYVQLAVSEAIGVCRVYSDALGTAPVLPLVLGAGAAVNALTIETSGNVLATRGAIGYGAGAGGTVVQATSKSTGVTLNKPTGQITMNGGALAAGGIVRFTFSNSFIGDTDEVSVWISDLIGAASAHTVWVDGVGGGACGICVKNIATFSLSLPIKIGFTVRKGATS